MSMFPGVKRRHGHDDRDHGRLSDAAVRNRAARPRALQPVLEGVTLHRAAAAEPRPVHPDGLGRAAGLGDRGAQRGLDRARCRRRSDRRSRCGQCAAEGRRHPVPDRSDALRRAGEGDRGATEAVEDPACADDAIVRARFRPRLRCRAAAVRGRPAFRPARRRAVESRQDHRARAGRRLRHQSGSAQGRAGREPAAVAGDGLHRHLEHHHRRRDQPDRRALYRAGAGGRGHFQVRAGAGLSRQGRKRAAGDRDRTDADVRARRSCRRRSRPRRSWCA